MKLTASTVILILLGVGVLYLLWKGKLPFLPATTTPTRQPAGGGKQVGVKDDVQAISDDVASIFQSATKLFGGSAQQAPSTM